MIQAFKWKEKIGKEFLKEIFTQAFYKYCNRKQPLFKWLISHSRQGLIQNLWGLFHLGKGTYHLAKIHLYASRITSTWLTLIHSPDWARQSPLSIKRILSWGLHRQHLLNTQPSQPPPGTGTPEPSSLLSPYSQPASTNRNTKVPPGSTKSHPILRKKYFSQLFWVENKKA